MKELLETKFEGVCHNMQYRDDAELAREVENRISFSFFPCSLLLDGNVGKMGRSGEEESDDVTRSSSSDLPTHSKNIETLSSSDNIPMKSPLAPRFLVNTLDKGTYMVCNIRRIKSTLQTTYKMYLESVITSNDTSITLDPSTTGIEYHITTLHDHYT